MIKTIFTVAVLAATLAAPAKCAAPGNNHHGANASTQRVCDDIGAANQAGELRDQSHEVLIKLDGAKQGVAQGVRDAIDAYYSTNRRATAQRLLTACADAGAPEQ